LTEADYQRALDSCGQWTALSSRDRTRHLRAWREVYAATLYQKTGQWKHQEFDWHVFSFEFATALNGDQAFSAYELITPGWVFVVPEDSRLEAAFMFALRLPDFRPLRADVTVWPASLEWTMAFTHEESLGLGPYFSRREWM
jgi:hypothetical protein